MRVVSSSSMFFASLALSTSTSLQALAAPIPSCEASNPSLETLRPLPDNHGLIVPSLQATAVDHSSIFLPRTTSAPILGASTPVMEGMLASPSSSPDAPSAVFSIAPVDMYAPAAAQPTATPAMPWPQIIILPNDSIAIVPGGSTLIATTTITSPSIHTAVPSTTLASLLTSPALLAAHDVLSVDVADEALGTLWLPDICTCDTECDGECVCAEEDYEVETCVWPDNNDEICTWSP